jgi:hypothetical protein
MKSASISSAATGIADMKASGILLKLADHRAPESRCVATKNMADTASDKK